MVFMPIQLLAAGQLDAPEHVWAAMLRTAVLQSMPLTEQNKAPWRDCASAEDQESRAGNLVAARCMQPPPWPWKGDVWPLHTRRGAPPGRSRRNADLVIARFISLGPAEQ
jgi:hypothetical protein